MGHTHLYGDSGELWWIIYEPVREKEENLKASPLTNASYHRYSELNYTVVGGASRLTEVDMLNAAEYPSSHPTF